MWKKKLANSWLVWLSLAWLVLGQVPGELNAIASGEIYLTSTDLATTGASKVYVVTFSKAVGTTPVGTALGTRPSIQHSLVSRPHTASHSTTAGSRAWWLQVETVA